jgi:prevent-host-death family protein
MEAIRMPVSSAARKGVSGVIAAAEEHRVILTSHGRPLAVVDSAERLDESARQLREAALAVLDAAADLVSQRSPKLSLVEVCDRLGLDAAQVQARVRHRLEGVD